MSRRRPHLSAVWMASGPSPNPGLPRFGCWISSMFFMMESSLSWSSFCIFVYITKFGMIVEKLANSGAKMVIIRNSSRRASVTMDKVLSLGFDPSLFLGAITSGELTHQFLQRRDDLWFAALGRSCIHMTWGNRGAISLDGLGLHVVESADDADFILAHGTEAIGLPSGDSLTVSLDYLESILERCAQKKSQWWLQIQIMLPLKSEHCVLCLVLLQLSTKSLAVN